MSSLTAIRGLGFLRVAIAPCKSFSTLAFFLILASLDWDTALKSTSRWPYRRDFDRAELHNGIKERDTSLGSRFKRGRVGSVAARGRDGGWLRDVDFCSDRTRSSVWRGWCTCWRRISAPGLLTNLNEPGAFRSNGRVGDVGLGPPSFWQSFADRSGKRAE